MLEKFATTKITMLIFLSTILICTVVLAGCSAVLEQPINTEGSSDLSTARTTTVPMPTTYQTRISASQTPELLIATPTNTPELTITSTPEPLPSFSPTPSPWLIDRSTPFFFFQTFQTMDKIQIGYPNGQFREIIHGEIIEQGQPWSPDGTKYIFAMEGDLSSHEEYYIANLETGEILPLDFIDISRIFWSPDGRFLLYPEVKSDFTVQVMTYDFDTGNQSVLTTFSREGQGDYYYLVGWSPDSKKVAFVANIEGQYDLFVIEIETLNVQQITNDSQVEVHATWSPIVNQLLVATSTNEYPFPFSPFLAQDLYLINENGERQLLGVFDKLSQMLWLADGHQVIFSDFGRLCILMVEDLSQSCPLEEIFPAEEFATSYNESAAFSSDGQWLAFQTHKRDESPCWQSYILHIPTNEITRLEVESCLSTKFQWIPTRQ